MTTSIDRLSRQGYLDSAVHQLDELQREDPDFRIASIEQVTDLLARRNKKTYLAVLAISAAEYGIKHQLSARMIHPETVVRLPGQAYTKDGESRELQTQYVTPHFHEAFVPMIDRMEQAIGSRVLVQSGYRSPAYQAVIMLRSLRANGGDITKTLQRVAPPFYSQHNDAEQLAVDVMRPAISGTDSDFETSEHYAWLKENAAQHGFSESFPSGNTDGVMYEPWHWRHVAKRAI